MKTFAVWETECPEEGSEMFDAYTEKGAKRAYRKITRQRVCRDDMTQLEAQEMTPDMIAERMANA